MVLKDASGLVKLYAAVNVEQYNIVTTASSQAECLTRYKRLLGIESGDISDSSQSGSSDHYSEDAAGSSDISNNTGNRTDIEEPTAADHEADITIADIKYIDISGNTYIYLIADDDTLYRAKAAAHEDMLLLKKVTTSILPLPVKTLLPAKNKSNNQIIKNKMIKNKRLLPLSRSSRLTC